MALTKISRGLLDTGVSDSSDATAITISSSENVLVGSGTSNGISGGTTGLQVAGAGFSGMISATRHDNNAYGSNLMLGKSRNTSVGSNTIIQNGDAIGAIGFFADDGTNLDSQVAYITASVDGAPGENDTPGRLTFSTTADGSASATERMRIDSSGNLGIGTTSPAVLNHISAGYSAPTNGIDSNVFSLISNSASTSSYAGLGILAGTAAASFIHFGDTDDMNVGTLDYFHSDNSMRFSTNGSERMRIDSSGNLKFNSGFGSVGEAYGVRAWVNFDGNISSDAAIEEDGNVSSVVDNAVGDYTINFSSNMPDGHYAVSGFGVAYGTNNTAAGCHVGLHASSNGTYIPTTKTTSAVRVVFGFGYTSGLTDIRDGSIIIVR